MSYLVEQPPHCDLLRLSLSTRRFVRIKTGTSSYHCCRLACTCLYTSAVRGTSARRPSLATRICYCSPTRGGRWRSEWPADAAVPEVPLYFCTSCSSRSCFPPPASPSVDTCKFFTSTPRSTYRQAPGRLAAAPLVGSYLTCLPPARPAGNTLPACLLKHFHSRVHSQSVSR